MLDPGTAGQGVRAMVLQRMLAGRNPQANAGDPRAVAVLQRLMGRQTWPSQSNQAEALRLRLVQRQLAQRPLPEAPGKNQLPLRGTFTGR